MWGELSLDKRDCSLCRGREREISADFTAKMRPEESAVEARETAAVEPRPMIGPRVHSIEERSGVNEEV